MWVRRWILYVKPGLMAEAVAHVKTVPPEEGVTYRLLRPISGPEAGDKLIVEASFEDPDAQYASVSDPQPPNEWMQHWIELSQNRGIHELYQVRHAVETEGVEGLWVERRVRWVQDGKRGEALRRWRQSPPVPGSSWRVLTPRTGKMIGNILVIETACDSLTEWGTNLSEMLSTPEGSAWAASVKALEMHEPTMELLRVVPWQPE
jgi:hypothetical protein